MRNPWPSTPHLIILLIIGDCAAHGDYQDLPDELNQPKDNGDLAEEGEEDDQQVKVTRLELVFEMDRTIFGQLWNCQQLQEGGGLVNGIKLPNGRIIKKVRDEDASSDVQELWRVLLFWEIMWNIWFIRDES